MWQGRFCCRRSGEKGWKTRRTAVMAGFLDRNMAKRLPSQVHQRIDFLPVYGSHGRRDRRTLSGRRGGRVRVRLSRRGRTQHLRRNLQAGQVQACAGAPRAGRGACRRCLCALHRPCRRGAGDVGSRRHQRGDRHCHRLHGFRSHRRRHRPGADPGDRPGRVPGSRHRRHHASLRQAQLPRQGREGPRRDDEESVHHRRHRSSRSGGGRHAQGCDLSHHGFRLPGDGRDALLQSRGQGTQRPDEARGADAAGSQASDDLHRRRRGAGRCLGAVDRTGAPAGLSCDQHPDGSGRPSRHRQAEPRHAGHARHLRSQHGDAALRRPAGGRRALRRPRDRQPGALRTRAAQASSISMSTPRRFPSASRSTCRSSATSRTC